MLLVVLQIHHVLREGTELLHLHVMFSEYVLQKSAAVMEAAIARSVVFIVKVWLHPLLHLCIRFLAPRCRTTWRDHLLDDLVVLLVDADALVLILVAVSRCLLDHGSFLGE